MFLKPSLHETFSYHFYRNRKLCSAFLPLIFTFHLHENDQNDDRFHLNMITSENGLQRGKILEHNDIVFSENDPSKGQRYEKDMNTDMKTYSCGRRLVFGTLL